MIGSWSIAAKLVLLAGAAVAGFVGGSKYVHAQWTAERLERAEVALEQQRMVRAAEQRKRQADQEAADAKDLELRRVSGRLADALGELRKRADRPVDVSGAGREACAGATGAELSGADAAFLAREAARADTLRALLAECQAR